MKLEERVNIFGTLDRYRNHELPPEERSFVELKLKNDPVWQEEWTYLIMIDSQLDQGSTEDLQQKIDRWRGRKDGKDDDQPDPPRRQGPAFRLVFAAAIAMLIAVGYMIFFVMSAGNSEGLGAELYAEYFQSPDVGPFPSSIEQTSYHNIRRHYKEAEFEQSLQLIDEERARPGNADNDTLLYYSAINHIGLKNTDRANVYFTKVLQQPQSVFYRKALWHLSLELIKNEQWIDARQYLTRIKQDPKHYQRAMAGELLREMDANNF